jgi:hypothetical protein
LAVELDGTGFVPRDKLETHLLEQSLEHTGVGMGKFHELKTIGACRVFSTDLGGRRIMRERTHFRILS